MNHDGQILMVIRELLMHYLQKSQSHVAQISPSCTNPLHKLHANTLKSLWFFSDSRTLSSVIGALACYSQNRDSSWSPFCPHLCRSIFLEGILTRQSGQVTSKHGLLYLIPLPFDDSGLYLHPKLSCRIKFPKVITSSHWSDAN